MTCAECMEAILIADLRDGPSRLDGDAGESMMMSMTAIESHAASCERCGRAVDIIRSAEQGLADSLVAVPNRVQPESLAAFAYRQVRRARLVKWIISPLIVLSFFATAAVAANTLGADLKTFFTLPPAVETQTFSLNCLSADQAASLLRPYLPMPQNPMWQAERFDVRPAEGGIRAVTVRAPRSTLAQVPSLLSRFEGDPQAACRVHRTGN